MHADTQKYTHIHTGLPAVVEAALAELDTSTVHRLRARKHPRGAIPNLHTSPPVNQSNVARLSADLVRRARNRTLFYRTSGSEQRPTVMLMWGGDWTFSQDAALSSETWTK